MRGGDWRPERIVRGVLAPAVKPEIKETIMVIEEMTFLCVMCEIALELDPEQEQPEPPGAPDVLECARCGDPYRKCSRCSSWSEAGSVGDAECAVCASMPDCPECGTVCQWYDEPAPGGGMTAHALRCPNGCATLEVVI